MVVAAIDDGERDAPTSSEIGSLLAIIDRFESENAKLLQRIAELERVSAGDGDLRPLKALLETESEYERARRGAKRGLLRAEQRDGRLFSTSKWVAEWRRITGR